MGFAYNAPQTSQWHNPHFTTESEEMKEVSDQFLHTKVVIV
jgi:hypothetical protein